MKRLYIETYGCQMNVADSEVVASVMKMAGYDVCEDESQADAIFINTCPYERTQKTNIQPFRNTLCRETKGTRGYSWRIRLHG